MNRLAEGATVATALGCGIVAGSFFAFSAFVMPALNRLEAGQSTAAMQSINKLAVTPAYMTAVFGTAAASVALGAWAISSWGELPAPWILAGCSVYVVGAIGVTIAANVPLNDTLATIAPGAADASSRWRDFVSGWTPWNHVRAAASVVAAGLLTVGLRLG